MTDAKLLLRGYQRWGTALAEHLEGDFAFVIWDERRRVLYAGRDPFGVRTLFYRVGKDGCAFASEVDPLVEAGDALEEEVVLDYLLHDHSCPRQTFFRDVLRVQPGHWLLASPDSIVELRYWHPPPCPLRLETEREYAGEFRRLFRHAVDVRLDRDCPTVTQLSAVWTRPRSSPSPRSFIVTIRRGRHS